VIDDPRILAQTGGIERVQHDADLRIHESDEAVIRRHRVANRPLLDRRVQALLPTHHLQHRVARPFLLPPLDGQRQRLRRIEVEVLLRRDEREMRRDERGHQAPRRVVVPSLLAQPARQGNRI